MTRNKKCENFEGWCQWRAYNRILLFKPCARIGTGQLRYFLYYHLFARSVTFCLKYMIRWSSDGYFQIILGTNFAEKEAIFVTKMTKIARKKIHEHAHVRIILVKSIDKYFVGRIFKSLFITCRQGSMEAKFQRLVVKIIKTNYCNVF